MMGGRGRGRFGVALHAVGGLYRQFIIGFEGNVATRSAVWNSLSFWLGEQMVSIFS